MKINNTSQFKDLAKHLKELKEIAFKKLTQAKSQKELESIRVAYLGKKGELSSILKNLDKIPQEKKPQIGRLANEVKENFLEIIKEQNKNFQKQKVQDELKKPQRKHFDWSLPGRQPIKKGSIHPITQTLRDIQTIFQNLGFQYQEGPELEDEYYNFDALNMPASHPARDEQDSFYISKTKLLRTQTSPMQIRIMEQQKPPLAVISPGRCFRRDTMDATHSHTFHQFEGIFIDRNVSMAHLKGTLRVFAEALFGKSTKIRFRPDFFPFTEPSAEFSVYWKNQWIELGGCGLVDPKVFSFVHIDPEIYSGYAFGIGIERLAMVKYGIPDIRIFYENDLRFLRQF